MISGHITEPDQIRKITGEGGATSAFRNQVGFCRASTSMRRAGIMDDSSLSNELAGGKSAAETGRGVAWQQR